MPNTVKDQQEATASKAGLPAAMEELVIENKYLRQRLLMRAAEIDSLRARISTLEVQIKQEAIAEEKE